MNKKELIFALLLAGAMSACKTAAPVADRKSEADTAVAAVNFEQEWDEQQALPPVQGRAQQHWGYRKHNYNAEASRPFRLLHTRLEVRPDWKQQQLQGQALLSMAPYFYPQQQVVLDAKGFEMKAVGLADAQGKRLRTLPYTYDGRQLIVQLGRSYAKGEKLFLYIDYVARPNELAAGGSDAITSDKGLYFINPLGEIPGKPRQLWTQGETQASSCWFPTFDSPNVKTTQELIVTVDKDMVTLSNGRLVNQKQNPDGTRTDYWKQDKPHAPYLFTLAAGDFAIVRDQWRGKEVSYYVEKPFAPYARQIFGNTPEMMEFFSKRLGYDYPWDKYAQIVVRDFVSGAMENTSASVFMDDLQTDAGGLKDMDWDFIIAHELFHQWFGDLVTCESWPNLPLNEAFANYSEYLWREHKHGKSDADYEQQQELENYLREARTKQEPLIRYFHKNREDMFDSHSYAKGGLIMHYLRSVLGDEAFFTSLGNYLRQREYNSAEIHHLRTIMEETVGQDLHWFFDPWFMQPGHPILQVSDRYENGKLLVEIRQEQDTTKAPLYRLPLALDVWQNGRAVRHQVVVDDTLNTFTFPMDRAPELVLLDPDRVLPGQIGYDASAEKLRYTAQRVPNVRHRLGALSALISSDLLPEQEVIALLAQALKDPFWGLRKDAADMAGTLMAEKENARASLAPLLQVLAKQDNYPQVRASALGAMASTGPSALSLVEHALQDSSYLVQATALAMYPYVGGSADPAALYARYEGSNNVRLAYVLADYYAEKQVPGKADWFIRTMGAMSERNASYFFNLAGQYAITQSQQVQRQLAEVLLAYVRNSSDHKARIKAYTTLGIFEDPEIRAKVQQLRQKETHPEVIEALGVIEG